MGTNRSRLSAAWVACATLVAGAVVTLGAAPAQAGWTDASSMTRYSLCREAAPSARGWVFLTRVRKRAGTEDARAGISVHVEGTRRQRWSSGWLRDREVDRGWVRAPRAARVRIHVWQEAGDRDSMIGTALERRVLRPRQVDRCG